MLRFLTAGESHGQALVVTVDGMPAGLRLDIDALNLQLRRRQGGYGRGRRMQIESDRAEVLSGVRHGTTTGAPIALLIRNRDWVNWQQTMYVESEKPEGATGPENRPTVTRPRPGHADLAGAIKYGHTDIRDVLERASARETASRVAAGSLARQLLGHFGIRLASHVSAIGGVALPANREVSFDEAYALPDDPLRCADTDLQQRMIAAIDAAKDAGDTLGGAFEVIATGVPPGLGSYVQWDRKLDGRLAQAMMCIHAIKAVGIGIGPDVAFRPGSRVHDEILPPHTDPELHAGLPQRPSNNAGGLEGGVTNGQDLRVSGFMKPIATLMKPLRSVDLNTLQDAPAAIERSDVCAVPAAAVVGEAMVSFVLADAFLEKFGGDSIDEIERHRAATAEDVARRFTARAQPTETR
jgi:chorismate synthase